MLICSKVESQWPIRELLENTSTSDYWTIFVGFGLVCGIGQGLVSASVNTTISSYFTLKKNDANEVVMAGISSGQILLSIVIANILPRNGYQFSVILTVVLVFIGMLGTFLFRHVKMYMKVVVIDDLDQGKEQTPALMSQKRLKLFVVFSLFNKLFGLAIVYVINISFIALLPIFLYVS